MISNQKHLFNLPKELTYLNCSFMSPMLKKVEEAGISGIRLKRNPTDIGKAHFFDDADRLRTLFARLINAQDHRQIAILPSVSYGLATAARNIKLEMGQNIVLATDQFPSNVYIWQEIADETGAEVRFVSPGKATPPRGHAWNKRFLETIDENTAVAALGHVHWADGTLFDLEAISEKVHRSGGYLIIDGTQSIGALPFDVQKIQPDVLITAGYKWLMGPFSTALGWYGKRLLDGDPLEESWLNRSGSEDFSNLVNYADTYQPGAARYDVGERSNFILIPMLIAALEQILEWTPEAIQDYCQSISEGTARQLTEAGFALELPENRGGHIMGIYLPDEISLQSVREELSRKHISVSIRGESIRVSPHLYNKEADFEILSKILISADK